MLDSSRADVGDVGGVGGDAGVAGVYHYSVILYSVRSSFGVAVTP